jgi:hypothetical protein
MQVFYVFNSLYVSQNDYMNAGFARGAEALARSKEAQ